MVSAHNLCESQMNASEFLHLFPTSTQRGSNELVGAAG